MTISLSAGKTFSQEFFSIWKLCNMRPYLDSKQVKKWQHYANNLSWMLKRLDRSLLTNQNYAHQWLELVSTVRCRWEFFMYTIMNKKSLNTWSNANWQNLPECILKRDDLKILQVLDAQNFTMRQKHVKSGSCTVILTKQLQLLHIVCKALDSI